MTHEELVKHGEPQQCFQNAANLVIGNPKYRYVEGMAMGVIPTMHAWVIDAQDRVIDNTWMNGVDYFGVVIPFDYLLHALVSRGYYGVIDNWQQEWPVLRLGFKKEKNNGTRTKRRRKTCHAGKANDPQ